MHLTCTISVDWVCCADQKLNSRGWGLWSGGAIGVAVAQVLSVGSDLVAGRVCWFGVEFGRDGLISGRISWLMWWSDLGSRV